MVIVTLDYEVELTETVALRSVRNNLYTGDADAHEFRVKLMQNGIEQDVSGCTVKAAFVDKDGVTTHLVGEVKDNTVCVTLSSECYTVGGAFKLFIRAIQDETKCTVLAVKGNIVNT